MIYPPRESAFYQMYPNADAVDIKCKNQLNPFYTQAQFEALYRSFVIENPKDMVTCFVGDDFQQTKQIPFDECIRHVLREAVNLPTARLWLRQIPVGIHLTHQNHQIEDNLVLNGFSCNNTIGLSTMILQHPVYCIPTLIHELAHSCDSRSITGLSIFPYAAVNQGSTEKVRYDSHLTEREFFQLVLIEEAEKRALSKQLEYEMASPLADVFYVRRMNHHVTRYWKHFSKWTPLENTGCWTAAEIGEEQYARTMFYAGIETMSASIRDSLQPYYYWFSKLPKAFLPALCKTKMGPVIDYRKTAALNLSDKDLERILTVTEEIRSNLSYRLLACQKLVTYLEEQYCLSHGIDLKNADDVQSTVLYTDSRLDLTGKKPSAYFNDYISRIEGRYLGYIQAGEMRPRNTMEQTYCYRDKKEPSLSLIDIADSYERFSSLYTAFVSNFEEYFQPYYESRLYKVAQQKMPLRSQNGRERS